MPIRLPRYGLLVALAVMLDACVLIRPAGSGGNRPPASPPPQPPPVTTGPPTNVAIAPPPPCPATLSYRPRGRVVRLAGLSREFRSDAAHSRFPWAEGHREVPPSTYFISRSEAAARVIDLERQHPDVIPDELRDNVMRSGEDPSFRLWMATCELEVEATHRRASYDAALAYLFGAAADAVRPILDRALDATDRVYPDSLTQHELEIEDALSRGVMGEYFGHAPPSGLPRDALLGFGLKRHSLCGQQVCSFSRNPGAMHPGAIGSGIVLWDLRDGGFHDFAADRCRAGTGGFSSLRTCAEGCPRGDTACVRRCVQHCD